jgi:hypothetical protein
MLLVILGAGASYDSIPYEKWATLPSYKWCWQPPLAKDLFEDRDYSFGDVMQSLPECLPLIIRLRRAVDAGRPVEEAMRELLQLRSPASVAWQADHSSDGSGYQ